MSESDADTLLAVRALRACYGEHMVLSDIEVQVKKGEKVTVIGANGAGKTTLLHCIAGLLRSQGGSIYFNGEEIGSLSAHDRVRRKLALVPEGRKIFPRLTVKENLELGAFTRSDVSQISTDFEHVITLFPILRERLSQSGGTLSGGEQQMLAIARALMSHPSMLLLDEPSMGVAPIMTEKIFETLEKLNTEGVTILLIEQNAHLALRFASRAYVLETGKVTMQGDASDLIHHEQVRKAYLGE